MSEMPSGNMHHSRASHPRPPGMRSATLEIGCWRSLASLMQQIGQQWPRHIPGLLSMAGKSVKEGSPGERSKRMNSMRPEISRGQPAHWWTSHEYSRQGPESPRGVGGPSAALVTAAALTSSCHSLPQSVMAKCAQVAAEAHFALRAQLLHAFQVQETPLERLYGMSSSNCLL